MLDNNIQNNTQNENEKVVQNGIQNVHQKFTARQNELRLYIINFTIDNKRPYNLESDKMKLHFRYFRWMSRNMKRLFSA